MQCETLPPHVIVRCSNISGYGHGTLKDRVGMQLPNGERAIVPIEKLHDYCLHPTHRVGSHKAHGFESVLGLTAAHAEDLQQRLLAVARTGEAVLGMQNAYG